MAPSTDQPLLTTGNSSSDCNIVECRKYHVPEKKTVTHKLCAEALGTGLLVLFGCGSAATTLRMTSTDPFSKMIFQNACWSLGVCFGILLTFDISGGHINPAVTLHLMVCEGFGFIRGIQYMFAQTFGAFLGALLVSFDFVIFREIPKTTLKNFYTTSPAIGMSFGNAFLDEVIATAILILGIKGIAYQCRGLDKFHAAGFFGLLGFAIGLSLGELVGFGMNPARDFGPRLCWWFLAWIYKHDKIYATVFGDGYFWVPIAGPFVGALLMSIICKLTIYAKETEEQVADNRLLGAISRRMPRIFADSRFETAEDVKETSPQGKKSYGSTSGP